MTTHTLSVLVENGPGVLARTAGLFAARGFNIHSLAVGTTEVPEYSRMTIVVDLKTKPLEQVVKQLNKLINVIKVIDFTDTPHVERELVLIKVKVDERTRGEVANIIDIFRGKIIDVSARTYVVEATGAEVKIEALIALLAPIGILEIVRTGRVAMFRGPRLLTIDDKNEDDAA